MKNEAKLSGQMGYEQPTVAEAYDTYSQEVRMGEILQDMAAWHVEQSNGNLTVLKHDPEQYDFQRGHVIKGNPQSPDTIIGLASFVEPRFDKVLDALEIPQNAAVMNQTKDVLEAGGNVVVVTNHSELTDIGLTHAGVYCDLARKGVEAESAIIISKMIAYLQYRFEQGMMPAPQALQLLCNTIFTSFPRTKRVRESDLGTMSDAVDTHNQRTVQAVIDKLDEGGVLMAIAPSGTTDKFQPDAEAYVLEKVKRGTAKLLAHENTFVLPIAVWFQDKQRPPLFKITDDLQKVETLDDVHGIMENIATTLNQELPCKNFTYH